MDNKGIDDEMPGCSSWYIVQEAECIDDNVDEDEFNELFEKSDSSCGSVIDDSNVEQGNSLALFRRQEEQESEQQLAQLKRKYLASPVRNEVDYQLSPRLAKVSLTAEGKKKVKKSLFVTEDSGIQTSYEASGDLEGSEAQVVNETVTSRENENCETGETEGEEQNQESEAEDDIDKEDLNRVKNEPRLCVARILKAANRRALLLKTFRNVTGISFSEISREFKSDKTCSDKWVVAFYDVSEEVAECANVSLKAHCEFFYLRHLHHFVLMLLQFKTGKSRETVQKLFKTLFNSKDEQLLSNPPKTSSVTCALYWYQRLGNKYGFRHGELPDWIHKQVLINHTQANEKPFELSQMVQWALDNNHVEEHDIAFEYASIGREDSNAAAFLKSNNQPKHVRDCSIMVKHFLRAQMNRMTMSEYVHRRCMSCPGEEDPNAWRDIVKFLRYEGVEFIPFLVALKYFFKKIPKKQCIVLCGPSNTGKSFFATSMIKFLGGRVISYANASSHFWLQPLADAKIGLLDDATLPCWRHLDINLRNALDGNPFSLDCKHRNLMQLCLPPLLITSNIDISKEDEFKYLATRVKVFCFNRPFPFDSKGAAAFKLETQNWRSFFRRFWEELEFEVQSEDEFSDDGEGSQSALKFYSKSDS